MGWVVSTAGLLVVLVALWDIFHTLWHPGGFGLIARWVFRFVWRASKRVLPGRTRQLSGAIGVLGTVMAWTGMVVTGWALVYLPHLPDSFGDIVPADPLLRLLTPFEALLGFVLLTAAISWILQVYPALGRRRSAAKRLSILRSSRAADLVAGGEPCVASRLLESVTDSLVQVETDFLQYAESYYFLEQEDALSLAATLPYALTMADAGRTSSSPEVRFAASVLASAVESLASRLDRAYLGTGAAAPGVLSSYAHDHGFESQA